jgi:hypothetical protein
MSENNSVAIGIKTREYPDELSGCIIDWLKQH